MSYNTSISIEQRFARNNLENYSSLREGADITERVSAICSRCFGYLHGRRYEGTIKTAATKSLDDIFAVDVRDEAINYIRY